MTHPDDLSLVQAELDRQVAAGERPAGLWPSLRSRTERRTGATARRANQGPDATQPRVTVRPKPPVLLGATSTMGRWHRAGVVSDNPRPSRSRRLQGSHRDAPRTIAVRILVPTPVALPLRGSPPALDPALQRSLGFPPVCLAASLRASLAPTFRCSLEVRRALRLRTADRLRLRATRGQWPYAKSRCSPHLSSRHPQAPPPPSPALPHGGPGPEPVPASPTGQWGPWRSRARICSGVTWLGSVPCTNSSRISTKRAGSSA